MATVVKITMTGNIAQILEAIYIVLKENPMKTTLNILMRSH
jgi:hypothetical protein